MSLEKYRLKNVPEGMQVIVSSKGIFFIKSLTDEQAALLYRDGQSHYIELAPSSVNPKSKKRLKQ
jgi:ABC-type phosphate transport system substrate-binding protein